MATARKSSGSKWATAALKVDGAVRASLPAGPFPPQLAKLVEVPPSGGQWLHELKWDGYRLVATIHGGRASLWSRNALPWTDKVPGVAKALEGLGLSEAALDGELIAGEGTQADFNLLQSVLAGQSKGPLSFVLFDILHVDGVSIAGAELRNRKALLADILKKPRTGIAYSTHIDDDGAAAFDLASQQGFEGVISKRADRPYHGGRSDDWKKSKSLDSDEFAVVGYTPAKGARKGFGSLLLAKPQGKDWIYAGRVGTGFTDQILRDLTKRIGKAGGAKPTVVVSTEKAKDLRGALWFPPMFVVEAHIRGIASSGVLRQPSLKATRLDKDIKDLADSDRGNAKASKAARKKKTVGETAGVPARLTSPDKIIFPDVGLTKQDVANYYLSVMDQILPEIAGRPLSVIRCPSGAEKPCFFQKHHTAGLDRIRFVKLKEERGNNANYLVVDDAEGLMELVQFNALEFHPWGSRAYNPNQADRVVFDLDPGPEVPFAEVKRAATQVRDLLKQLQLTSYLRTSGGKGLHVVMPLNPASDWAVVKQFAKGFAEALAGSEPERFLSVSTLKLRPGKIFVDYLRNGRGATSVASYSLRARKGAPVALPLAWSELGRLKRPDAFNLSGTPTKVQRRKSDPWEGIDEVKQTLAGLPL